MMSLAAMARSSTWKRGLSSFTRRLRSKKVASIDPKAIVVASGRFDAVWYVAKYPDVAAAGLDPLNHFLNHGGTERRSPAADFDTRWYLDAYPDAAAAAADGLNPLVHFLRHGQGRAATLETLPAPLGQEAVDIQDLLDSSLFDAKWYAKTHRTTAEPLFAARHYLRAGARLGLPPSRHFDGGKYLQAYPDVASAGDNPLLHYLRHGQKEGRRAFRSGGAASSEFQFFFDDGDGERGGAETASEPAWTPASQFSKDARPALRAGGTSIALLSPDTSVDDASLRRLSLFAQMLDRDAADFLKIGRRRLAPATGSPPVLQPEDLSVPHQDIWFSNELELKLRIPQRTAQESIIRAWQMKGDKLALLSETFVGQSGRLATLPLTAPLDPILFVTTRLDGELQSCHLLPFPSLARSGLHHGEAESMGRGGGSVDRQSSYSYALLREALGWTEASDLAIRRLEVDISEATGNEAIFSNHARSWLSRLGIEVGAIAPTEPHPGQSYCSSAVRLAPPSTRRSGGILRLSADSLPSLLSVCSRRLSNGDGAFIVTDATGDLLPRLMVRRPTSQVVQKRSYPYFTDIPGGDVRQGSALAAIRYVTPPPPSFAALAYPLAQGAEPMSAPRKTARPLTVILYGKDTTELEQSLEALALQTQGMDVQRLICLPSEAGANFSAPAGTELVEYPPNTPTARALNTAANLATGDHILFVDCAIRLHDARIFHRLQEMMQNDRIATASCMRLCDVGFKGDQAVTVRSAGLFPTHVDFSGSPSLAFRSLDVASALDRSTFAVAANGLEFAMVSAQAWRDLGGFDHRTYPFEGFGLDFQLRALSEDWTNLCTTEISVLDLKRDRDESPDSLCVNVLDPGLWGKIFERITSVRRLD